MLFSLLSIKTFLASLWNDLLAPGCPKIFIYHDSPETLKIISSGFFTQIHISNSGQTSNPTPSNPSVYTYMAFIAFLQRSQVIEETHSQSTPLLSFLVFPNSILKYSCIPGSCHQPKDLHLWVSILR